MKTSVYRFLALALFVVCVFGTSGQAVGQSSLVSMHMEPVILEQEVPFKSLAASLEKHTRLEVKAPEESTRIQIFYGIGKGRKVAGPFASDPLTLAPGRPVLTRQDRIAIDSPWEGFDDPLVGFVDPLVGFVDPLLGFGKPHAVVINHEEQIPTPDRLLEAIWGNGNVGISPEEYGLVLFAASVEERAAVLHSALVVPFRVSEAPKATSRIPRGQRP